MAKPLILSFSGQEFPINLQKVDRDKLYGSVEIEAFDEYGNECFKRVLCSDGKTLIEKGGTALAMLNDDGRWIDRKDLVPIGEDGQALEPVPSSYSLPNELRIASIDEYLSTIIDTVYLVDFANEDSESLRELLAGHPLFRFNFSYRGGFDYKSAFLLENKEGIFLLVGTPASLRFVKLNENAVLDDPDEQELEEGELDFEFV